MLKKLLIILLSCFLTITLLGCGDKHTSQIEKENASETEQTPTEKTPTEKADNKITSMDEILGGISYDNWVKSTKENVIPADWTKLCEQQKNKVQTDTQKYFVEGKVFGDIKKNSPTSDYTSFNLISEQEDEVAVYTIQILTTFLENMVDSLNEGDTVKVYGNYIFSENALPSMPVLFALLIEKNENQQTSTEQTDTVESDANKTEMDEILDEILYGGMKEEIKKNAIKADWVKICKLQDNQSENDTQMYFVEGKVSFIQDKSPDGVVRFNLTSHDGDNEYGIYGVEIPYTFIGAMIGSLNNGDTVKIYGFYGHRDENIESLPVLCAMLIEKI